MMSLLKWYLLPPNSFGTPPSNYMSCFSICQQAIGDIWLANLSLFYKALCVCAKLFQSCPTVCDPRNYRLPGSSVHWILQARILEWVACPPPGDLYDWGTELAPFMSLTLVGGFFTTESPEKSHKTLYSHTFLNFIQCMFSLN